ncbi:TIGR02302 family protein [Methylocystis suflitae]|uniref:TIGR02302 family protein n=1 Tax=Methylocystis suflitae TaxID=2951405 RepID=UPI002108FE99|nr:TIGR02302 family protein [Methylocystis suflitae]MCQ4188016.1 TIGR02302 family protein [Methylocystis suflitae]
MDELQHQNAPSGKKTSPRLEGMLRQSALAILAERIWRAGLALATIVLVFLALSWLGLWQAAPLEARIGGVALFGFAALYVVARESARGWPHRAAALERLDRGADAALRPASSLEDRLASQNADAGVEALWALHRQRLETALAQTPIEAPHPRVPQRDPYALRALALVAAVAAGFAAGDEKRARIAAAFDWRASASFGTTARVDAWLEPPAYTGRPPIVLAKESDAPVEAPVNSTLRIRPPDSGVSVSGGLVAAQTAVEDAQKGASKEQAFKLSSAARVSLSDGRRFNLAAIPDKPPSIALTENPRNNVRGSMTLAFRATDDYGVVGAEAVFSAPPSGRRALYEPPRLALALPPGGGGQGEAKATIDLADSPFGGAKLAMRLVAKDAADNEGASESIEVTLPQRRFVKPLARALAEQRRILALDPDSRSNVRAALEALSIAPEAFDTPAAVHLGLREARRGLEGPRSDDELRGVCEMLWAMALGLEEGDASQAERELRAAERELKDAIARGDSEQEIANRAEELRAALDKFLQQLGSRLPPEGSPRQESEGGGDTITPDELQAMLDEMNRAMKSGDMAQAQRLLEELQDILENVQTAQGAGQRRGRGREMARALNELDQLSREEQQLRDETFQGMNAPSDMESRGARGHRQKGQNEELSDERQRQQALRERLERQQDALREGGVEAAEELDEARRAMKEAEDALGKAGEGGAKAVDAQGRAVQALRKGADRLAQQMRGDGDQNAEEEGGSPGRRGRRGKGRDPLGRAPGDGNRPDAYGKYDPLGLPPAQRAHRVQEELRRRLGQPERPQEELDYLQRLLRR